jgi:glycerate-2-kinase
VTLGDKQRTTRWLLRTGATIQEINTVRKHLSAIKGGRLATATRAKVVTLILSDVIGNNLGAIGSGPTVSDSTTYADACRVLHRHGIWSKVPARVRMALRNGVRRKLPETPKPGARRFQHVQNEIIGDNGTAVAAVAKTAAGLGMHTLILSTSLTGEAQGAASVFGAVAREIAMAGRPIRRPACVIAGGELTVTVQGRGRGGRAQEFALAAAREIAGLSNVWIVGFGTDGTDGPTDAAGAVVDGMTWERARRIGVNPQRMLDQNDSYRFFQRVGGHITTGPTRTNVNDLYLLLLR